MKHYSEVPGFVPDEAAGDGDAPPHALTTPNCSAPAFAHQSNQTAAAAGIVDAGGNIDLSPLDRLLLPDGDVSCEAHRGVDDLPMLPGHHHDLHVDPEFDIDQLHFLDVRDGDFQMMDDMTTTLLNSIFNDAQEQANHLAFDA